MDECGESSCWSRQSRQYIQIPAHGLSAEAIFADDLPVEKGAGLGRALEGLKVHRHQTETGHEGGPLVIVHERPVEVAAHIHAALHRLLQGREVQRQVDDAKAVINGGAAILGDVDRIVGSRSRLAISPSGYISSR